MSEANLIALQAKRTPPPKRVYRRGRLVCRYCGDMLAALARGRGACDAKECKKKDRRLRDQIRRERDEIETEAMRAAAARAIELERLMVERLRADASREIAEREPAEPAIRVEEIATTCHTTTPLVDLEQDMIDNFRERMLVVLTALFEQQDEDRANGIEPSEEDSGERQTEDGVWLADLVFKTFEQRKKLEQPVQGAEIAACAACRGQCCEGGFQNLAYVRPADAVRYRRRNPGATPESMIEDLMAYAPEKHVQYSCLFHGEYGCTLPREKRNNLCNGFKCHWLLKIGERLEAGDPPRLVAAFHKNRPQKAFFIEEDGELTEVPVNSSISSEQLMAEAASVARKDTAKQDKAQTSLSDPSSEESRRGGTGS